MRKFFKYIATIMCLVFLLPFLLTIKFNDENIENNKKVENKANSDNQEIEHIVYDYGAYKTIKVQMEDGSIVDMNLDEYLLGVVSAEMPAEYDIEALKAQAVVARTYTLYTIIHSNKHGDGIICTSSSCCQAWLSKEDRMNKWDEEVREANWNKIEEAVYSTSGEVIEYNGEVIDAFFHANSGGKTEVPINVWGGTDYPYLQSVETSGEDGYTQYSSENIVSKTELEKIIKEKYNDFSVDWNDNPIEIKEYTDSNRVKTIKIGNKDLSGVEVRTLFNLKSANFICQVESNNIKFLVKGYGHGVGLSQTGADSMAKSGASYKDIINHFYANVQIVSL